MMEKFRSYLMVIVGNLLLAISVVYFVLPYDILSGGVAGIALILRQLFNMDTTFVINGLIIALFLVGWVVLGKEFAIKTFLSSAVYPIFITILSKATTIVEGEPILVSIFGGIIAGVGIGLVIREDASTGGTDIPPLVVHKYTHIPIATLMSIFDAILVLTGLVAYGTQEVMLGLVYVIVSNFVIGKVIVPKTNSGVELLIVSDHKLEIADYIHQNLERGTTILKGYGGFTGEDKEVILTVIAKHQYLDLSEEINRIDPYAFVIVSEAKDIKGEGFTYEYRV